MNIPTDLPRLEGFRYPREIIAYAVWVYHRFALSTADVEDLLAERGIIVSRETVRFRSTALVSISLDTSVGTVPERTTSGTWTMALPGRILRSKSREGRDHDPWQETLAVAGN